MSPLSFTGLLCLLPVLFGGLRAQSTLSYSLYMDNVSRYHPMVKMADVVAGIGEEGLKGARGNYDPGISGSYNNKYYQGQEYFSVFESEIKQALFTNQSIKAGYQFGQGNYLNPSDYTPGNGLAYLGVEAALLQGLILDKRRADVLKARQYREMSRSERLHIRNTVLFESACLYNDWLLRQALLKLNGYFARLSQVRLEGIIAFAEAGERPAIDTTETSLQLQQRLLDFQSALIDFQKQSAMIASSNWSNDQASNFDPNLLPVDSLELLMELVSQKFLQVKAAEEVTNPLVLQYRSKINIMEVEKRYRAELVKPVLNLNYNLLSLPANVDGLTELSFDNYKWGAQLSFPLFLRNSRANLSIAKLQLNASRFEYELKQNEINNKLRFTASAVNVLSSQLLTAMRNADYSKRMLDAEKQKFENGESSVFLINARESKWLEAEIKRLETTSKYIRTVFEYIYLKGNADYY